MKNSLNDEKKSDKSEIVQINSPMTLLMYQSAIDIVVDRLKAINIELTNKSGHHVIRGITRRIKSPESITKKLIRKGKKIDYETAVESLNDIAGVRAVSYFFDDIYQISKAVKKQKDFTLIKEKDYVQKPKKSGYKSIHLIVKVPVVLDSQTTYVKVEIQIRTFAMDYWAELDSQMCYKKSAGDIEMVRQESKRYAEAIAALDNKMLEFRKKIELLEKNKVLCETDKVKK